MKPKRRMGRAAREQHADYLINWFLQVFDGHMAPYSKRSLNGIAIHMRAHMAGSDYKKYHYPSKGE